MHGYIQGKTCKYLINEDLMLCKINNTNPMQYSPILCRLWSMGHVINYKVNGEIRSGYDTGIIGLLYTEINQK